jgi:hypothetical protein
MYSFVAGLDVVGGKSYCQPLLLRIELWREPEDNFQTADLYLELIFSLTLPGVGGKNR